MKSKHGYTWVVLLFFYFLALIFLIWLAPGCMTTSKTKTYERDKSDSINLVTALKELKELRQDTAELWQTIRNIERGEIIYDTDCDTVILEEIINSGCPQKRIDSFLTVFNSMRSTIRKLSDGTIEATGRIKAFRYANESLVSTVSVMRSRIEKLERDSAVASTRVIKDTVKQTKEKKGISPFVIGSFLFGLLAMFVLGIISESRLKLLTK